VQTFRGASSTRTLPADLSAALHKLSRQSGSTLFMTLLAGWQGLLARYSGQTDITVGTPIANRTRVELEQLIGFFVNTLVLRTDLSGDPTFNELLARVREVTLGAYAHQDVPFEKLVEELQPERSLSRAPLFQTMLTLQNAPRETLSLPALTLSTDDMQEAATGTTKFELTLNAQELPAGLLLQLEYNTDLFAADTMARMLGHYEMLLAGIVAHPDARLADLPLVTPAETHQLLVEWNDTTRPDYLHEQCLHDLFAAQAARTPDAIAATYETQQLSYRELNERANQLAHYLRTLGVGPDMTVGVCMERSLEMVIALLGILKAGGAYVPFDPEYPQERLAFMFADAGVSVMLTQERLLSVLPAHAAQVLCLDTQWDVVTNFSIAPPEPVVTPDNLAYV
ncbi:MAG TPA: condensation domain-containing protein, partial [Pyrinomonadaceae bacterium]|nr:condensation domain-containing protein [Pyrinomonadaceae bacterium]